MSLAPPKWVARPLAGEVRRCKTEVGMEMTFRHCEQSDAIQSGAGLDCRVASLLAMTVRETLAIFLIARIGVRGRWRDIMRVPCNTNQSVTIGLGRR